MNKSIFALLLAVFFSVYTIGVAEDMKTPREQLLDLAAIASDFHGQVEWNPSSRQKIDGYQNPSEVLWLFGETDSHLVNMQLQADRIVSIGILEKKESYSTPPGFKAPDPPESQMEAARIKSHEMLLHFRIPRLEQLKVVHTFHTPERDDITVHLYRHSNGIRFYYEKVVFVFETQGMELITFGDIRTEKEIVHPPTTLPDDELAKKSEERIAGLVEKLYNASPIAKDVPYAKHHIEFETSELMIVDPSENYLPFIADRSHLPLRVALVSEYRYGPPPEGLPKGAISGRIIIWVDAETGEVIGGDYSMAIQLPAMAAK